MSAGAFALANLAIWVVILIVLGVTERRGRNTYVSRHRGVRYRRITTADMLKTLRKMR